MTFYRLLDEDPQSTRLWPVFRESRSLSVPIDGVDVSLSTICPLGVRTVSVCDVRGQGHLSSMESPGLVSRGWGIGDPGSWCGEQERFEPVSEPEKEFRRDLLVLVTNSQTFTPICKNSRYPFLKTTLCDIMDYISELFELEDYRLDPSVNLVLRKSHWRYKVSNTLPPGLSLSIVGFQWIS